MDVEKTPVLSFRLLGRSDRTLPSVTENLPSVSSDGTQRDVCSIGTGFYFDRRPSVNGQSLPRRSRRGRTGSRDRSHIRSPYFQRSDASALPVSSYTEGNPTPDNPGSSCHGVTTPLLPLVSETKRVSEDRFTWWYLGRGREEGPSPSEGGPSPSLSYSPYRRG